MNMVIFLYAILFFFSEFAYGMQSPESVDNTQEIASSTEQCLFFPDLLSNRYTLEQLIARHQICYQRHNSSSFNTKKHPTKRAQSAHNSPFKRHTTSSFKRKIITGLNCNFCDTTDFVTKQSLAGHLNKLHLACGYCSPAQQFSSPEKLLEHTAAEHENVIRTVSRWMATKEAGSGTMKPQEMICSKPEKADYPIHPQEDTSQGSASSLNNNQTSTLSVPSETSDFIRWLDNYLLK